MRAPDDGLRALFRAHLPAVHWTTVESGALAPGTPDSEGCHGGVSFWVEYKATDAWRVALRPEQVGWHLRRARAGGRSLIAVRRRHPGGPRLGAPADELWLLSGRAAALLTEHRLDSPALEGLRLSVMDGGPARWSWARTLDVLTLAAL